MHLQVRVVILCLELSAYLSSIFDLSVLNNYNRSREPGIGISEPVKGLQTFVDVLHPPTLRSDDPWWIRKL